MHNINDTKYQNRQRMHRSSHLNRQHLDRSQRGKMSKFSSQKDAKRNNIGESKTTINQSSNGNVDDAIFISAADEARYNLATRIMSNGVEVIVAGDKSTLPGGHPNSHLRILTTSETFKMPLTLAPSTLKNEMHLMLPQTTTTNNGPNSNQQTQVSGFLFR